MTKDQILRAAEQLAQAWRANQTIERFSGDLVPKNRETAVAISKFHRREQSSLPGTRLLINEDEDMRCNKIRLKKYPMR